MDPQLPIQRPRTSLKVRQQRDRHLERGQLARLNGIEAVIAVRGRERVRRQPRIEGLRLEGADAAAQLPRLVGRREDVPGHEEGR
ncbi:hypothetical protein V495_01402 [Pseudogymnoascus sp. VKM F-4514 (FW-929)]|nr:hypothetical protein V495_01402 [Pseudogymnoascus sp. VKM F-4514 (FW-929)]